jgi:hypothetical protein
MDLGNVKFPTSGRVTMHDGHTAQSTVTMALDRRLLTRLRRGLSSISCNFGYAKPASMYDVSFGTDNGVTMSYILKLKGAQWEVQGWNF